MPLLNELIVSIIGGVITALILSIFTRGSRASAPRQSQRIETHKPARGGFGNFLQVLLAVTGGVAFAVIGGRVLFQSGVLERSLPMRMALLVGAIIVIWMLIGAMRSRH